MNDDGHEVVDRLHREAVEHYWEQERCGRELVRKLHGEAIHEFLEEQQSIDEAIDKLHRETTERSRQLPAAAIEPADVPYTELPEAKPGSPLYREWNTYRREAGRLLAEGHAGRHVLIKGEEIVGIWAAHDEAMTVAYERFVD